MLFCEKQLYCDLICWWWLYILQRKRGNWCIIEDLSNTFKLTNERDVRSYLIMNGRKIQMKTSLWANLKLSTKSWTDYGFVINQKRMIHQQMLSWKETKTEIWGSKNGTIVQWMVNWIILLKQLYLIFSLMCINVKITA